MLKNKAQLLARVELAERELAAAICAIEDAVVDQFMTAAVKYDEEEQTHIKKAQPTAWVSSGKFSIQQGLMTLRRAIQAYIAFIFLAIACMLFQATPAQARAGGGVSIGRSYSYSAPPVRRGSTPHHQQRRG